MTTPPLDVYMQYPDPSPGPNNMHVCKMVSTIALIQNTTPPSWSATLQHVYFPGLIGILRTRGSILHARDCDKSFAEMLITGWEIIYCVVITYIECGSCYSCVFGSELRFRGLICFLGAVKISPETLKFQKDFRRKYLEGKLICCNLLQWNGE